MHAVRTCLGNLVKIKVDTLAQLEEALAAGVDLISAGWLTHSATVLDIGLDWRD